MEKIKDEEPFETINITGFGAGYERAAQLGLRAGIKWLEEHPEFVFDHKQFKGVYGICESDSQQAKELDKVMLDAMDGDMTGAQHQCVINHLQFIHTNDLQKWLDEFKDRKYTYPQELPEPSFSKS